MELIQQFKNYLLSQKAKPSVATVKNYAADISHFISWFENTYKKSFAASEVTLQTIKDFRSAKTQLSASSLERHISSLRKFFQFLKLEGKIAQSPFEAANSQAVEIQDPWHLKEFKDYLYVYNASRLTIKNYLIDVKQFFAWLTAVSGDNKAQLSPSQNPLSLITEEAITQYRDRLFSQKIFSASSINRKLSSLRKYLTWAKEQGLLQQAYPVASVASENTIPQPEITISNETAKVIAPEKTDNSHSYSPIPPVRLFQKALKGADLLLEYGLIVPLTHLTHSSSKLLWKLRGKPVFFTTTSSLKQTEKNSILKIHNISKGIYAPLAISVTHFPFLQKLMFHARYTRPNWYKKYHQLAFAHYMNWAILIVLMTTIGFGLYSSFVQKAPGTLAALPTAPPRILSFQGRLTDTSDTPITAKTNLRFAIYNDLTASGSALFWQEVDGVTPDANGVFSTILGKVNGIPSNLFTSNQNLYLGVTVEQTPELTPRQQLATVAFASNSETLQGLPPITQSGAGTQNVVLALDSSGNLTIGSATTFQSTSGLFTISGNTLALNTNSGTNGSISLYPDGQGFINLGRPLQSIANNNNISSVRNDVEVDSLFGVLATSSGQSAVTIVQNGGGPIISASAGASARFTVDNAGNTTANAFFAGLGSTYVINNATSNLNSLTLANNLTVSGNVASNLIPSVTDSFDLGSNPASGGKEWNNLYVKQIITSGQGGIVGFWQLNAGVLAPTYLTNDVVVGGTSTTSAKFQIFGQNYTNDAGTVTAGTATSSGNFVFTGNNPTVDYLNGQSLVFKRSPGGDLGATSVLTLGNDGNSTFANNLTINGNSVLGAASSNTITANGEFASSLIPATTNTYNLGSPSLQWGTIYANSILQNGQPLTQYWQLTAGVLSPVNIQNDLAVGGTSSTSAVFHVFANSGTTPVASIAAQTSFAGLVVDNKGVGDLFTASTSGLTKFTLLNSGSIKDSNYTTANGILFADVNGLFTQTAQGATHTLLHGNGSGIPTFSSLDLATEVGSSILPTANGGLGANVTAAGAGEILYSTSATAYGHLAAAGSVGLCLTSNGAAAPNWGSCGAGGVNWWNVSNGALYPINTTLDVLFGGNASNSANFAFLNNTPGSGTPTASISGNLTLNSAGVIATTNMHPLTIGSTTTGPIQLSPKGTTGLFVNASGNVGIGNTAPLNPLSITGGLDFTGSANGNFYQNRTNSNNARITLATTGTTIDRNVADSNPTLIIQQINAGSTGDILQLKNNSSTVFDVSQIGMTGIDTTLQGNGALVVNQTNTSGLGDIFSASASGVTKFTIANDGTIKNSLIPNAADTYDLGSPSKEWNNLYVKNIISGGNISGFWQLNQGVLAPTNIQNDLAVGGAATGSATPFQVFGESYVNDQGTVTAGTATTSGNLVFRANSGSNIGIQYLNGSNFVFQKSAGGDKGLATVLTLGNDGNTTVANNLAVNGGSLTSTQTTFNLLNSSVTTLNLGGAVTTANLVTAATTLHLADAGTTTTLSIGGSAGTTTVNNALTATGTFTANGNTILGANNTKTITANGEFNSDLIPSVTNTDSLGSPSLQWKNLYVQNIFSNGNVSGFWQLNSGVLSPANIQNDLAVGNTSTGSATPFQVFGTSYANDQGTVTAGTATTSGNLVFRGTPGSQTQFKVDLLNGSSLVFNRSVGGDKGETALLTLNNDGSITAAGNATINGNTTLGTSGTNTITPNGDFNASLIPTGNTINLGSSSNNFGTVYATNLTLPITGGQGGFWNLSSGVLAPTNIQNDLAVGGNATNTAKFQVFANTGNATTSGNFVFGGSAPTISTTSMLPLVLGDAITGAVQLSPKGTTGLYVAGSGNVGIGTTTVPVILTVGGTTGEVARFASGGGISDLNFISVGNQRAEFGYNGTTGRTVVQGIGAKGIEFNVNNNTYGSGTAGVITLMGFTGLGTGSLNSPIGNTQLVVNQTNASGLGDIIAASASGTTKFIITNSGSVGIASGINDGNILSTLDVRGNSGITSVASVSGQTSFAALVVDNKGVGDLFTASTSGLTKFTILNSGSIKDSNYTTDKGILFADSTGLFTQTAQGASNTVLHGNGSGVPTFSAVDLTADVTGTLPINHGGTNGTAVPTAGALAYGTGTAYAFTAQGTSGQCLISSGAGTPSWSTCTSGTAGSWWNLDAANGVLYPINSTVDLLVGSSATASAKFAVTGIAGAFTPAASVSATVASGGNGNGIVIKGDGSIQSLVDNQLILGGNTTGDIVLKPANGAAGGHVQINISGFGTGVVHSNASGVLSSSAVNLANGSSDITGTLTTTNGGTGLATGSLSSGDILYYNSGTAYTNLAKGADNTVLNIDATTHLPVWTASPTFTNVTVNTTANLTQIAATAGNKIIPTTNGTLDLGDGTHYFNNIYANNVLAPVSSGTSGFWALSSNNLYPVNDSFNLLVGGTSTSSATPFQVFAKNYTNDQGTVPSGTATVSGNLIFRGTPGSQTQFKVDLLNGSSLVFNRSVGGDKGETAQLTLNNDGSLTAAGNLAVNGGTISTSQTTATIFNSTVTNLSIGQAATTINLGVSGGTITIPSALNLSGNFNPTGQIINNLIPNSTSVNLGDPSHFYGAVYANNIVPPTNGSGVFGYWQRNLGALSPTNIQDDLILGATSTSSAKFAVLNMTGTGNPTASISSGLSGTGMYFDSTGTIQTVNNQSLTLGGTTTGNILLHPVNDSGQVVIGNRGTLGTATDELVVANSINATGGIDIIAQAGRINFTDSNGGQTSSFLNVDNGAWNFNNGSNGALYIDTTGNVAIGTVSPTDKLDIVGSATESANLSFRGTNTLHNINALDGGQIAFNTSVGGTGTLNTALFIANGNNATAGHIGINNTNPSSFALQVAGDVGPNATDTYNLGSPSLEWNNLYIRQIISPNGGGISGYWQLNTGVLAPVNTSNDLVIGVNNLNAIPSTASARFQVFASGSGAGSISANLNDPKVNNDGGQLLASTNIINIGSTDHSYMKLTNQDLTIGGHKNNFTSLTGVQGVYIYDTAKDSDGGRWTNDDRAQASSWYNEARTAADACVIGTNTRCGAQAFPRKAIIVVVGVANTSGSVYIFDAKDNSLWMTFNQGAGSTVQMIGPSTNSQASAVAGLNGKLYIAKSRSSGGVYVVDFTADTAYRYMTDGLSLATNSSAANGIPNIANRNTTITYNLAAGSNAQLLNNQSPFMSVNIVNGKTYIALGGGGSGTGGSVALINDSDKSFVAGFGPAITSNNVWLTSTGTLYALICNSTCSNYALKIKYNAQNASGNKQLFDDVYAYVDSTHYGAANNGDSNTFGTNFWTGTNGGPASTSATFVPANARNAMHVTEGTSFVDGKSDTVYLAATGSNGSVMAFNLARGQSNKAAVKYYTQNYITEDMIGDIRGMYPLDSNVGSGLTDVSAAANTLTNGVTAPTNYTTSGVRNQGATLVQNSQAIASGSALIVPTATGLTVSAWVKPTTLTTTAGVREMWVSADKATASKVSWGIGTKGDGTGTNAMISCFATDTGGTFTELSSTIPATAGSWYHVGLTSDSAGNLKCYVNGQLTATGTISNGTGETPTAMHIGHTSATTNFQAVRGAIDEVTLSATPYTPSEISHLYQVGFRGLQNHGATSFHGVSIAADQSQQINGGSSNVTGIAVDNANSKLYIGTNQGGITGISLDSDSAIDAYYSSQTTKDDTGSSWVANNNAINTLALGQSYGNGMMLAFGSSNGGVWMESNDTTLKDFFATNFNPFGMSLDQSNLNVDNLLRVTNSLSTRLDNFALDATSSAALSDVFRVDNLGQLLSRSASNSATAMQFQNSFGSTLLDLDTANFGVGIGGTPMAGTGLTINTNSYNASLLVNQLNANSDIITASTSGTTQFRVTTGGTVVAHSFYDLDSYPSYFLDPAAGGTSMTVAGNVGIGTTGPTVQLSVVGAQQATFNPSTTTGLGGTIEVGDTGGSVGNGGAILFSAHSEAWKFAEIKGYVTDASNNSTGNIVFATRHVTTDSTLTSSMVILGNGNVGIGNTAPGEALELTANSTNTASNFLAMQIDGTQSTANTGTYYGLNIGPTYTAASGNTLNGLYGLQSNPLNNNTGTITNLFGVVGNPANNSTGTVTALDGFFAQPYNNSSGTVTNMYGIYSQPLNQSSGTITSMFGGVFQPVKNGTGAITSMYGAYFQVQNANASGAITNGFGVYIDNAVTTGTITNKYALVTGPTAGNVGIGTTGPGRLLDVVGASGNGSAGPLRIDAGAGGPWTEFHGNLINGGYNNIVQAGDHGIIFSDGSAGTGKLVIAPWASATSGIRMTASGNVGIGMVTDSVGLSQDATLQVNNNGVGGNLYLHGATESIGFWDGNGAHQMGMFYFDPSQPKYYFHDVSNNVNRCSVNNGNGQLLCLGLIAGNQAGVDYAENIQNQDGANAGDILVPDQIASETAKKAATPYDPTLLGTVSTHPGFLIVGNTKNNFVSDDNMTPAGWVELALAGRVPTKVSTKNGTIKIGDKITSSTLPGVGMKATQAGAVVGEALATFDPSKMTCTPVSSLDAISWPIESTSFNQIPTCYQLPDGTYVGKIMALVKPSWNDPDVMLTTTGDLQIADSSPSANFTIPHYYTLSDALGSPITRMGAFLELAVGNLRAGSVNAQQLFTNSLAIATDNVSVAGQSLKDYIISVVTNAGFQGSGSVNSPIASIDHIHTGVISPLGSDNSIALKLGNSRIDITNGASGSAVASIDASGNATFSGQLNSQNLAVNGDATVSGTLHANRIEANTIAGLEAVVSTLSAQNITNVNNIYFATPSAGTLSENIPTGLGNGSSSTSGLLAYNGSYDNLASFSSYFAYVPNLKATTAQFEQGFMSLGPSSMTDVTVSGQLSIGSQLVLADTSVNVLGADFQIQPLRQGGIQFEGGLIAMDTNGNLTVDGKAIFNGTLATNIISPLSNDKDLTLRLGQNPIASGAALATSNLSVQNASGSGIFTIDQLGNVIASGAATIGKLNLSSIAQPALAVSDTEIIATGSAGTAAVKLHQVEVTIDNPLVTDKSLIYITPVGGSSVTPYLLRQVTGKSFTVGIPLQQFADTTFNWLIVN